MPDAPTPQHEVETSGGAWAARAEDLAGWAMRRLVNRTDRCGRHYRRGDKVLRCADPADGANCYEGYVSKAVLARHFRATRTEEVVGLFAYGADKRGKWTLLDIDNHGGADPEANRKFALKVYADCVQSGLSCLLYESNANGGFHLWVLFSKLVPAVVLHRLGLWLAHDYAEFGLGKAPESFPKNEGDTEWGHWVRIPGRHHKRDVWPSVWAGKGWVTGDEAVAHVLSLEGADPALIPTESIGYGAEVRTGATPTLGTRNPTPGWKEPFEDYNQRATIEDAADILERHGWTRGKAKKNGALAMTRPGKSVKDGESGNLLVRNGVAIFYCFTDGAEPLKQDAAYAPSALKAVLDFGGDFAASNADLKAKGYGSRPRFEVNGFAYKPPAWTRPASGDPEEKKDGNPRIYNAVELAALDLPDLKWAIPGILGEGLTLLAGRPKLGKSWLALNMALTIAAGGTALKAVKVQPGDVLYLALEDRLRRIKDRMVKVLRGLGLDVPPRLNFAVDWPRQHENGLEHIANWMETVECPRLVVIDVWAKFRPPNDSRGSAYEQDYEQAGQVKSLADHYGCALLPLHHSRKMVADDVFDEISGTLGLSGAADASMVLTRSRGEHEANLAMTGRDIEEQTLALEFDPKNFTWTSHGSAEERLRGDLQKRVVDYLRVLNGRRTFTKDVADQLEITQKTARTTLGRLFEKGIIRKDGMGWAYPGEEEIPD